MKYLFIVQGEGRGHLTQALSLEEMLIKNGHEVVEVLVGGDTSTSLPGFFNRKIKAPVRRFESPHFSSFHNRKQDSLIRSILIGLIAIPKYVLSLFFLHRIIRKSGADIVINFYEVLTGLTYALFRPDIPYYCVGHQYLFLHPDFKFPKQNKISILLLCFFTRLTSLRCQKRLALSFHEMDSCKRERIYVVPPILRPELNSMWPEMGDYIHGYMLHSGFADEVENYARNHPKVKIHFFWDRNDVAEKEYPLHNLCFHRLDDEAFLESMARCRAYANTAGFESICEAIYLGKPVLMVPVHIEQECNAFDAALFGAGIIRDHFDLDGLIKFSHNFIPNYQFTLWVKSSERIFMQQLQIHEHEKISPNISLIPA